MPPDGTEPQTGRETRLLVLVVGVAIVVLLLLAQWQYPGADLSMVSPSGAPLAGLAARVTFDDMASTMADVVSRVSPLTIAVPLERDVTEDDRGARGTSTTAEDEPPPVVARPVEWGLAVRVRTDMALLYVPAGLRPQPRPDLAIRIVAHDTTREMMLLRVAASNTAPDTLSASVRTVPSFLYVAAVDGTPVGPTVQPIFLGRADSVSDSRWSHALVPASAGPGLRAGSLVFSLNSRLVGIVVGGDDGPMVVPAPAIETFVQALETQGVPSP